MRGWPHAKNRSLVHQDGASISVPLAALFATRAQPLVKLRGETSRSNVRCWLTRYYKARRTCLYPTDPTSLALQRQGRKKDNTPMIIHRVTRMQPDPQLFRCRLSFRLFPRRQISHFVFGLTWRGRMSCQSSMCQSRVGSRSKAVHLGRHLRRCL